MNKPTSASFLVTEDCNLRCTYCFEKHKPNKMSKQVARDGLDFLCNNAKQNNEKYFSAMIFGGEPLLAPDIVEEIFSYGLKLAQANNMVFTTSMVTNATILTPKIKQMINKYKQPANLSLQLSIDGIKKIHDTYRVTKNGKGSFDIIEKNISEWKALFADDINRLSVHGCCNKDTLPYLFENYKFFREEWQIPRIWFMPIHSEEWDIKDIDVYEEQLTMIADYILERCKHDNNYQEVINYAPIDRCLNPDVFPDAPCGAGKNFITIAANGDLYPCHQIYFNDPEEQTKIGDLATGIDEAKRAIFLYYDNNDLSCAKLDPECDAYHCYRCIGENWQQNGSILSVVDCGGVRCKMSKIERKIQLNVRKELSDMGLLTQNSYQKGNNPDNPACLCDSRSGGVYLSDENKEKQHCNCGGEGEEIIAMALKTVLDKLDTLEKGQEYILKKVIK